MRTDRVSCTPTRSRAVEVTPSHHRSVWLTSAAVAAAWSICKAWNMQLDGSRVAADPSHEDSPLIRKYGEPGRQRSTCTRMCISEARNSQLSLARGSCTEHRFGKIGACWKPADGRWCRFAGGRSASRIPASDRDLLPSPAHFSYITSVPEFNFGVVTRKSQPRKP